ncbi:MAG: RNA-guided endonuclease IscB [Oscillospiraceae bacterium]|nr:RNA-guided endonuclease IscB [Oscillospiraceae bacterium]
MVVYVISKDGKPLMPTTPARAKKKLRSGKAKCIRRTPFTIKLTYDSKEFTQPLTHGIDTGSSIIGSAVVDNNGEVVYLSEIEIRNDITDKMKQRAKYRRNRRNRKTRYRKARWQHRKNSIRNDRFSPTMTSKINSHLKEIRFVKSILPITHLILETATFDPHALKNPAVLQNKWLYQKGINYGFANTKAFVLDRDSYTCQYCGGKTKDSRLHIHHITFRMNGGSDEADNLITLCKTCHDKLHDGLIQLKGGKHKGQLRHATQMNSIRQQLLRQLNCDETFGFITKEHRQLMSLPKEHHMDAVAVASQGNGVTFKTSVMLQKKCLADGDYQKTKGIRSEQPITTDKICGFKKFDKVRYGGIDYFIKGRMSTGYAILMNIHGEKVAMKPIPKLDKMKRISARKSWIIQAETIRNIV